MHTAGIYADMTVDGPEIGTLVIIVDRAKNLPNRKTMGKQNPYCAARLGKEAKKTDTDQRGGQTPRWDQELRFTVHDSPDYNNLKLSIFNDDKKTDLISEAWISLLDVLQPGGGQNDQWHHLTFKGKYAGEIRMELTYYDTRPRAEGRRVSDIQDSSIRSHQQSSIGISGARQPSSIKRRPLPNDPSNSGTPVPSPRMGPRDYSSEVHSPSTVGGSRPLPPINVPERSTYQQELPELDDDEPNYVNEVYHDADQGEDIYDIPVSDDPYALQALEDQHNWEDGMNAPEVTVPRNARVEALSNYSISRASPAPLNHTQSAPILGSYEQVPQAQHAYPEAYSQYDDYENQYPREGDPQHQQGQCNHSSSMSSPRLPAGQQYTQAGQGRPPPAPPTHRNSAPNLPRMAPASAMMQYSNTPTRALHMSTSNTAMSGVRKITPQRHSYADPSSYQQESYNDIYSQQGYSHHIPASPPYPDQRAYHQEYSQEPQYRPQQPPFDSRRSGDYRQSPGAPRARPPPQQNNRPYDSPQPYSPHQPQYSQKPQYRSQPHSPMPSNTSQYNTPQYHSPRLPPSGTQSPGFPPPRSNPHTPSHVRNASLPMTRKSISPLPSSHTQASTQSPKPASVPFSPDSYSNPDTPQTKTLHIGLEPDVNPLAPDAHSGPPIIGSDGRVKDPSDHLPVSSYAPEPDSKKNGRPSIQVNVRNRFGPRELGTGSPLGVGSGNGGGPPPVPGKVPLSGGNDVTGLESGVRGMSVDSGAAAKGAGGVFGRMRRLGG